MKRIIATQNKTAVAHTYWVTTDNGKEIQNTSTYRCSSEMCVKHLVSFLNANKNEVKED